MWRAGQSWHENTKLSTGVFKATFLNCVNKWKRMGEKTFNSSKHLKDILEDLVRGVIEMDEEWWMCTYPDSSTTGTWSNPFSRRISTVLAQVTVGSTVRGAERLSSWMLMFHHLGMEWKTIPCKFYGEHRTSPWCTVASSSTGITRESQDSARANKASGLSGVIPSIRKSLKCEMALKSNSFPHFICFLWLQIVSREHRSPQFLYLSLTQKILHSYSKTYLFLQWL